MSSPGLYVYKPRLQVAYMCTSTEVRFDFVFVNQVYLLDLFINQIILSIV